MPALMHDLQPSFAGGELSPAMRARVDLAKYQIGLAKCYNFLVHAHGGASNRPGFRYVSTLKLPNKKARLIPFQFSNVQSYMLEFGDGYIRFYKDQAPIVTAPGVPYEIVSPYTEADLPLLKYTQSADVLFLAHPNHKPMKLSRTDHTAWTLSDFSFKNGPYLTMNTTTTTITPSATTGTDITLTASAPIFEAGHVGAKWKLGHNLSAQSVRGVPGTDTIEVTAYDGWRLETSGYWTGSFKLLKQDTVSGGWQTLRSFSSQKDRNYSISDKLPEIEATQIKIQNVDFATADATYPGKVLLECLPVYYEGHVEITSVTSATVARAKVIKALGSTAATAEWAEGAWSTRRGWPGTVMFVANDRLAFGSTTTEPHTAWMSRVGDYINFEKSLPTVDDDPITAPLLSRQVNTIRHLVPLTNIVALTAAAEFKIWGAGTNKVLTPNTTNADPQTYYGASDVIPLIIGNRVLYVQDKGSTVRDLGYELNEDSYKGGDLSILAKHLFRNRKVTEWCYQQEPDSIVWATRDDGALLGLTYMREHDVFAWHRHYTHHNLATGTFDKFESVATISSGGKDEVWSITQRTINGAATRFVEVMAERLPDDNLDYAYFMDAGLSYHGAPATQFSGLTHLEGETVQIVADGAVMAPQVVTDGKVTLANPASHVHVGLGYYADMETLAIQYTLKNGTSLALPIKIPAVAVEFENTVGCLIGPDVANLVEIPESRPSYGTAIPLYSGQKRLTVPGSFGVGAHLYIRQKYPLPITVLAIMPDVAIGG